MLFAKENKNKETQDLEVQDVAGIANDSQPEAEVQHTNPEKFLEEFNWHNYEEGIDPIDDEKLEEFEKLEPEQAG